MITEDFEIAQRIFTLISEGIIVEYDSFAFTAEIFPDYIETELVVSKDGQEVSGIEANFNNAVLVQLLKEFKSNFVERGEDWESFTMSYNVGEQVKTHFTYSE